MPRRSAAQLASPSLVRVAPPRLSAPPSLPAAEQAVWTATVRALPGGWFTVDMTPLLVAYCRHVVRCDVLQELVDKADPAADLKTYGKLVALAGLESARLLACARAMRLTPQARVIPSTAGSKAAQARPEQTPEDTAEAVRQLVAWRRGEDQP